MSLMEKVIASIFLAVLSVTCLLAMLGMMWHGFDQVWNR